MRAALAAVPPADFARRELRHERNVHRKDAHLAFDAGQRDHVHILGIDFRFRRDDF